jgi:hypothetical protein
MKLICEIIISEELCAKEVARRGITREQFKAEGKKIFSDGNEDLPPGVTLGRMYYEEDGDIERGSLVERSIQTAMFRRRTERGH